MVDFPPAAHDTSKKEYGKAAEMLKSFISKKGNHEVLVVNLANVYIESQQYEKAVELLKRYKRNNTAHSVLVDEMLKTAYRKMNKTCELYQVNIEIMEYRGMWDQALNNVSEALRYCSEKNTLLRLKAWAGRISEKRSFYDKLLKN